MSAVRVSHHRLFQFQVQVIESGAIVLVIRRRVFTGEPERNPSKNRAIRPSKNLGLLALVFAPPLHSS